MTVAPFHVTSLYALDEDVLISLLVKRDEPDDAGDEDQPGGFLSVAKRESCELYSPYSKERGRQLFLHDCNIQQVAITCQ